MKNRLFTLLFLVSFSLACFAQNSDFTIAFGSCNKQTVDNTLWKEVIKHQPNLWIWGGDNVYSDTDNMKKMKRDYMKVLKNKDYQSLIKNRAVLGTWDDHDYGLNDGGEEFHMKKEAQALFLDFMGVSKESSRRKQEGVYMSQRFQTPKGSLKVIVLDTRYFRSRLKKSSERGKRYEPDTDPSKTMLGETQWNWLQEELTTANQDFVLIVSSIQILSSEHGFEKWANFPNELERLKKLVSQSNRRVILLSGDRHISEFSIDTDKRFTHPLIDFTSSGLTHAYDSFSGEPNRYRRGKVIHTESFGLMHFDFSNLKVTFEMRGENNVLQQQIIQDYN